MNLSGTSKLFVITMAFLAMVFAVMQIWFPDAYTIEDFMKFAGTIVIIFGFVAVFSMITNRNSNSDNPKNSEDNN